jgi:hypothetical protein
VLNSKNPFRSTLRMQTKECPKCGATWIDGKHYWGGTGKKGNELDLAGLVCNKFGDETCINPCLGMEGGVTWVDRLTTMDKEDEYPLNGTA